MKVEFVTFKDSNTVFTQNFDTLTGGKKKDCSSGRSL
jgi:hypothetical protein